MKTGREAGDKREYFYLEFSKFQARYLEHIAGEEEITQWQIRDHFSDDELGNIGI